MRQTLLLAAAAGSLLLGACDNISIGPSSGSDGDYRVLARLECPEREDQLRRVAAAADGQSCEYRSDQGEVKLQLVTLDQGSPDARLSTLEADLRTLLPSRPATTVGLTDDDSGLVIGVESSGDDSARVRLPGLQIDADGDQAQVRIGGDAVVINADDQASRVNIVGDGGSTLVDADESGAEVRVRSDEAGIRRSFRLTSDTPGPDGWQVVGYEARGPADGPLLVATLRQRGDDHGDMGDAVDDLVRKLVAD